MKTEQSQNKSSSIAISTMTSRKQTGPLPGFVFYKLGKEKSPVGLFSMFTEIPYPSDSAKKRRIVLLCRISCAARFIMSIFVLVIRQTRTPDERAKR
jgi:hypothetical protein